MNDRQEAIIRLEKEINLGFLLVEIILILAEFPLVIEIFNTFDITENLIVDYILYYEYFLETTKEKISPKLKTPELPLLDAVSLPQSYLSQISKLPIDLKTEPSWESEDEKKTSNRIQYCLTRLCLIWDSLSPLQPISLQSEMLLDDPASIFSKAQVYSIRAGIEELITPIRWDMAVSTLAKMLLKNPYIIEEIFGNNSINAHPDLQAQLIISNEIDRDLSQLEIDKLKLQIFSLGSSFSPIHFFSEEAVRSPLNILYERPVAQINNSTLKFLYLINTQSTLNDKLSKFIQYFTLDHQSN